MNRALATLVLAALTGVVAAAPPDVDLAPAPHAAATSFLPPVADSQELVVYTKTRPIRIRVSIELEGKPIAAMWAAKLRGAFDYFDRDKDGFLDAKEVQNIFSDTGMTQMLQNGFYQPTPQDRPSVDRLDKDGDGKISFAEYVAYYHRSTGLVFRTQPLIAENPTRTAVTEAIFKLMDRNKDGKLTRDEVKAIEHFLATRDTDEDECLSQVELLSDGATLPAYRGNQVVLLNGGRVAAEQAGLAPAPTVANFDPDRIPGTLTQQLIKRYDKDGDFDLTRDEIGFDDETFKRLDRDGNGKLDGEELELWRTEPAELHVSLSLAEKATECVAKVTTDAKSVAARGFVVKQLEPGRFVLRSGRQPIEFWSYAAVIASYRQPALKTQYQYLFTQAAKGKDHVLEQDLKGPNAVQFQFLRILFDPADANADGKLTRAEFDGFFDLQDSFRNIGLSLTPAIQTPTLFELLDENRDGRLGVRELRTAWERLIVLEPDKTDVVTRDAILPAISLRLSRSIDRFTLTQAQYADQDPNQQVRIPKKGPLWFRKMDRNADGDVSRSEFLGTRAEFDAIDTDHDALISLEEAEAYDKTKRPKDASDEKK